MAANRTATIAAIATPPGSGGIGVIRISGAAVPQIARTLLGRIPTPRYAHYLQLRDGQGDIIDSGLLLYFPAPASFTAEDVLELQVHGSRPVLAMLLRRLQELGASPARAGEFSERAFLNGKLDLAQAEAIADLIAAGSEAAARAAQRSLQGVFSRAVDALVEETMALRVRVEAAIDFSDDDIEALAPQQLTASIDRLLHNLEAVLTAAEHGHRLVDGLHVVILGRPNVGKSSLLNALAAEERAIVTAQAGTTRDLLRETLTIDGIQLTLVDTAGLRQARDPIELEGVRRARAEAARADLVLQVVDPSQEPEPDISPLDAPRLVVHNKIDLSGAAAQREWIDGVEHIHLSAQRGTGLDLLRESLAQRAGAGHEGAFSARTRHLDALRQAHGHLIAARVALTDGVAWELAAEDLRQAQTALGEITGAVSSEALLGRIFANFCIGK